MYASEQTNEQPIVRAGAVVNSLCGFTVCIFLEACVEVQQYHRSIFYLACGRLKSNEKHFFPVHVDGHFAEGTRI